MIRSHASIKAAADNDVYELAVTSTSISSTMDRTTRTSALINETFDTLQEGRDDLELITDADDDTPGAPDAPIDAKHKASLIRSNHSEPAGVEDKEE